MRAAPTAKGAVTAPMAEVWRRERRESWIMGRFCLTGVLVLRGSDGGSIDADRRLSVKGPCIAGVNHITQRR